MLLPSIAELLARVGRHPAVEETLDALRRGAGDATLAGLTDPAKALFAAHFAAELRRPVLLLVESNQRAELLAEPLRFFYRITECLNPSNQVPRRQHAPLGCPTACTGGRRMLFGTRWSDSTRRAKLIAFPCAILSPENHWP